MRWRLAALLGLREREVSHRSVALAEAIRREAAARAEVEALRAATRPPLQVPAAGTPIHALARSSRFAQEAAAAARDAALLATRASAGVEALRAEAADAARDRAALLRARARWEATRRRERERREEDARDDLSAGRPGRGD